jgi:hypothetical protein
MTDRNTKRIDALWRGAGDGPGSSGPESHGFLQGPAVFPRGIEQAKEFLGVRWVLHPEYERQAHHSCYALVDLRATFARVRARMRPSFSEAVRQTRDRLRAVHIARAA